MFLTLHFSLCIWKHKVTKSPPSSCSLSASLKLNIKAWSTILDSCNFLNLVKNINTGKYFDFTVYNFLVMVKSLIYPSLQLHEDDEWISLCFFDISTKEEGFVSAFEYKIL